MDEQMESSTPMMAGNRDRGEEEIIPCLTVYRADEIGAQQSHVHEFCGSTEPMLAGEGRHDHRFSGVTGEAIYVPGNHVHRIETRTDFSDHFHSIRLISGPPAFLPEGDAKPGGRKHVHFIEDRTAGTDGHWHGLGFATLVSAPQSGEGRRSEG